MNRRFIFYVFGCILSFICFGNICFTTKASGEAFNLNGETNKKENVLILEYQGGTNFYAYPGILYQASDDGYYYEYELSTGVINNSICNWFISSGPYILSLGFDDCPWIVYSGGTYSDNYKVLYINEDKQFYYLLVIGQYVVDVGSNSVFCYTSVIQDLINQLPQNSNISHNIFNNLTVSSTASSNYSFYYNNLSINYGLNNNNSCGYVAIGSLLSYYDIFYNDGFVIDDGGALFDDFIICSNVVNSFNVSDCVSSPGYSSTFHNFLITEIGVNHFNYYSEPSSYPTYATNTESIKNIIDYYLANYANISSTSYVVSKIELSNSVSIDDVNSWICDEIDNGRPVILGLNTWDLSLYNSITSSYTMETYVDCGHAVIAYGYQVMSNGRIFYKCHFGWKGANSQYQGIVIDSSIILGAVTIRYNGSHVCNNDAYIYKHNSTCFGFGLCHLYNDYGHYLNCNYYNSSIHKYFCPICGNNLYVNNHTYGEPYVWYNYTHHNETCTCGANQLQPHAVSSNSYGPGQQFATCLICGGSASIGFIEYNKSCEPFYITKNGSFILPNGVVVLVEKDINDFLDGVLLFYCSLPYMKNNNKITPFIIRREEYI